MAVQLTHETTLEKAKRDYTLRAEKEPPVLPVTSCRAPSSAYNRSRGYDRVDKEQGLSDADRVDKAHWNLVFNTTKHLVSGFERLCSHSGTTLPDDIQLVVTEFYLGEHDSALTSACWYGYESAAQEILRTTPEFDRRLVSFPVNCGRALYAAARTGLSQIAEELLNELRTHPYENNTRHSCAALQVAAMRGHGDAVAVLLNAFDDIPRCMAARIPPLNNNGMVQAREEDLQVAEAIGAGLYAACYNGDQTVARLLLNGGADSDLPRPNGATPLMAAAQNGHLGIVRDLLNLYEAKPHVRMPCKLDALSCAALNGHYDIMKMVFECMKEKVSNAQYNAHHLEDSLEDQYQSPTGWTALHLACMAGHERVVRFLVDTARMYFAQRDAQGMTPLDHAQQNGHHAIAEWLNKPNADIVWEPPSRASELLREEQANTRHLKEEQFKFFKFMHEQLSKAERDLVTSNQRIQQQTDAINYLTVRTQQLQDENTELKLRLQRAEQSKMQNAENLGAELERLRRQLTATCSVSQPRDQRD